MINAKLRKFTGALVGYCIIIILWGAWVRISGSGDGCGKHWPLCNGTLYPSTSWYVTVQTWIEYAHRIKSGLFLVLILFLFFAVWKKTPLLRWHAAACLFFTITEALLGALLVLGGYVDQDQSVGRAVVIAFHLGNTLLLLGSLTLLWSALTDSHSVMIHKVPPKIIKAFFLIFIIAVTGAWAALSTTLFPTSDLLEGLQADFSSTSHFLIRIRVIHPLIAILSGYCLWSVLNFRSNFVSALLLVQILFGTTTLLFHSPTWMKIMHLAIAQILWVCIVKTLANERTP